MNCLHKNDDAGEYAPSHKSQCSFCRWKAATHHVYRKTWCGNTCEDCAEKEKKRGKDVEVTELDRA